MINLLVVSDETVNDELAATVATAARAAASDAVALLLALTEASASREHECRLLT
jgi:hypothetical protein